MREKERKRGDRGGERMREKERKRGNERDKKSPKKVIYIKNLFEFAIFAKTLA